MGNQDYIVIQAKDVDELVKFVNNHVIQGYRPVGGITMVRPDYYLQAMIHSRNIR